ncbi:MAG: EAL domain-containing protein [Spirochaetes bacterium]|nr:EAL domain-containing protein [Spirochaetota bacterium]
MNKRSIYISGKPSLKRAVVQIISEMPGITCPDSIQLSDMIVFCADKNFDVSEIPEQDIASLKKGIPAVLLSYGAPFSTLLDFVRMGVFSFISLPANASHVRNEISRIASYDSSCNGEEYDLELDTENNLVHIKFNCKSISNFIISSLNNIHEQGALVSKLISRHGTFTNINSHEIDTPEEISDEEIAVKKKILSAIEEDRVLVNYQPIISLAAKKCTGFEALARIISENGEIIQPDLFIPVAEKSGIIGNLTRHMIKKVCSDIAEGIRLGFPDEFRISVNISAKEFLSEDIVDFIEKEVSDHSIQTKCLAFEITESAFMEDMAKSNITLLRLKKDGHLIYMDDFGTGYSSLSYLQHFPVDVIKIDKSFVRWMHVDEQSEHIVKSIVGLAHGLQMKIVAEGAEDAEHVSMLSDFGCEYSQGYIHSRPIPFDKAVDFIRNYSLV